jgi:GntR family transcriptional regulator
MPRPGEAATLQLPPGVPVVRVLRTFYDDQDRPVEVQDTLADSDTHQFRYEVDLR